MRLAVVSPFVDRWHGTERALAELLERLVFVHQAEVHLYSQRVDGLQCAPSGSKEVSAGSLGRIVWHKVPSIPGPHLLQYFFWYFANRFSRWRDRTFEKLSFDFLYSPGINAPNAAIVTVHIVFHAFYRSVRPELRFWGRSPKTWPRTLHRILYYHLIMALERRVYSNSASRLTAVSRLVALQLKEFFGRSDAEVIHNGVDVRYFQPAVRLARRDAERAKLNLSAQTFVLLLIGNDWKKKGLDTLLNTLTCVSIVGLPFVLLVVGSDNRSPYQKLCQSLGIASKVRFLSPSADVLQFYAASDTYVGPSLEDAYGLPVIEAMACGLPAIASAAAGVSEVIRHGENGFVLDDPRDSQKLAELLRQLYENEALRTRISEAAVQTAATESWEVHAEKMFALFLRTIATPSR